MGRYDNISGGKAILNALRADLAAITSEMRAATARVDNPVGSRPFTDADVEAAARSRTATAMRERVRAAETLRWEAAAAFRKWAEAEVADARRRYREDPVASAAEETRRLRNEMEVGRLVASANATGTPRIAARGYADDAMRAYLDGDYERAQTLGRAAVDLGQSGARQAVDLAQSQLDMAHPRRRQALADIANVELGSQIFDRDVNAAVADTLNEAAGLAHAVGDRDSVKAFRTEAARASMRAKIVETQRATEAGDAYAEPEGALPGTPTGPMIRISDEQLNEITSRVR